jgi:flagellar protein FlaG
MDIATTLAKNALVLRSGSSEQESGTVGVSGPTRGENDQGQRTEADTSATSTPTSRDELSAIVASIEDAAQAIRRDLSFSLDAEGGTVVVRVMDSNGELVRQIPSEEILRLRGQLEETRSLLFSATA